MEELLLNHQVVYYHPTNSKVAAMGLMTFGYQQFLFTHRCQNLSVLKQLCDELSPTPPDLNIMAGFGFNQLMDSIRITITFENFIKSLLLLNNRLIHKLDKNVYPDLYKEQFMRPIELGEVLAINQWEINQSIQSPNDDLKHQVKGILKPTLGMKELLSPGYAGTLGMGKDLIDVCNPFFQYRNNLHLYMSESFSIGKSDYSNFTKIIDFINKNLIKFQNQIVDELGKGESYKLNPIGYP